MDSNGWFDIGYNFIVGEDGNVYEGRGWTKIGAHSPGIDFKETLNTINTFSSILQLITLIQLVFVLLVAL